MKSALSAICLAWVGLTGGSVFGITNVPHMYVRDGQLKSAWFEVYITEEIASDMQPRLNLAPIHQRSGLNATNSQQFYGYAYPNQHWEETLNGKPIPYEGTLLLFDLSDYEIPLFRSAARATPSVTWLPAGADNKPRLVISQGAVYIAHQGNALLLTSIVMVLVVFLIGQWAKAKSPRHLRRMLISGPDGYLSLWRTQLAAWTVVVGAMVFCFGIMRLEVPGIPETLVTLMGMSLLTGGLSSAKNHSDAAARAAGHHPGVPENPNKPSLADLIADYDFRTRKVLLSLPKAQMAFWTILMLLLFVGKTLTEGRLWEVPWQLVTLTGFSQAGYIGDKFAKKLG